MYTFNPLNNQLDISSVAPYQLRYYGSFYDTSNQANPDPTTYNVLQINTTVTNFGVSIQGGNTIKIVNTGVYNLTFSLQLRNTHSQIHIFDVWLVINGNIVPNSSSRVDVPSTHGSNDGHSLITVDFMDMYQAGDEIQIHWKADDTRVSVQTLPAIPASPTTPEIPASPSVILTVQEV